MKLKLSTLLLGLLFWLSSPTYASHLSAGEFNYVHLGGNDYLISLYLYRDCSGINMPTSDIVNIQSISCGNSFNITLNLVSTSTVTAIPGGATTCLGGSIQGYEKYVFQDTVTMPMACSDWVFSYQTCCRNAAITNLVNASATGTYLDFTMNNTVINNSPIYHIEPLFYGSMGTNFSVALGGYDPDGDSLAFRLDDPQNSPPGAIPFIPGLSISQPLQIAASTSVSFSNTTGQFDCILDSVPQIVVFDVLIDEYRNGQLIGTYRRTLQILPLNLGGNCPGNPSMTAMSGGIVIDPYTLGYTSPSQPFSFNLVFTDNDIADILSYNSTLSSILAVFPDAQITPSYPLGTNNQLQLEITLPTPHDGLFNILIEENHFLQHSYSYKITNANTTQVQIITNKNEFVKVYPNPMETITTFEISEENYQTADLQIFDLTGRSIYHQINQGAQKIQFNRRNIPAGVYLYQVRGDGQLLQADLLEIK